MWKTNLQYLWAELRWQVALSAKSRNYWFRRARFLQAYKYHKRYERGRITTDVWFAVMKKYKWTCQICGKNIFGKMEVDHVIPVSKWGTSDWKNLQVLCKPCNQKKGSKI